MTGAPAVTAHVPTSRIPAADTAASGVPAAAVSTAGVPVTGVPAVDAAGSGGLTAGGLTAGVPVAGMPRAALPTAGVAVAGVPVVDAAGSGGLTAGGLTAGVPVGGMPRAALPTAGVPAAGLPAAGVAGAGVAGAGVATAGLRLAGVAVDSGGGTTLADAATAVIPRVARCRPTVYRSRASQGGRPASGVARSRYRGRHRGTAVRWPPEAALGLAAGASLLGFATVLVTARVGLLPLLAACGSGLSQGIAYLSADARHRRRYRSELRASLAEARRDPLTGLPNRAVIDERLTAATRAGAAVTVALADVDGLHEVNNRFGHPAGDRYLRAVAARLASAVPAGGCLVREGGDEFTMVVPDVAPGALAAALDAAGPVPVRVGDRWLRPRVSVGVAASGGGDAWYARACADAAMYTAKGTGGGRTLVYRADRDGRPRPDGSRAVA